MFASLVGRRLSPQTIVVIEAMAEYRTPAEFMST
jgi:hypothetical protein